MFTGKRLSVARKRRRLTKKGLAEQVGVTPHTILRYESGTVLPSEDVVAKLAHVLRFPKEFFEKEDDLDELDENAVSFRSLKTISAKDRHAALAAGALALLFSDWIDQKLRLPAPDLPLINDGRPESAAQSLRHMWGWGERPIKNMVHLLEAKGIRVFSLWENTKTVDAFSIWRGERPFVFLNMKKTPERSRFDAAHELGHLVLHRHGGPKGQGAEDEANRFASEFLMPAADVTAVAPRVRTLNQIVELKRKWGVSAFALIYRLFKLNILTEWQYRTLCLQASGRGMRETEEKGIAREQSRVWQLVLTALWNKRITKMDIAKDLAIPSPEIENLLFGLTTSDLKPVFSKDGFRLALVDK